MAWPWLTAFASFLPLVIASNPSVFSLDLQRHRTTNSIDAGYLKRDTISTVLDQISGSYFVNVSFGTPPQVMRLILDYRTADTWLNSANSSYCVAKADSCANYSTYEPDLSSSYKFISSGFKIQYVDGSGASGDYASDNMTISGATLNDIQFAVADRSEVAYGTLGLAYAVQEVSVIENNTQPYPNVPQALANLGLINSNAYSIWLNDRRASSGTLLFGGVDTEKYTGELRTIPIVPRKSSTADLIVPLTELRFGNTILLSGQNVTTGVDSSSSLTYLPDNITQALFDLVGARYDSSLGVGIIDCDQAQNDTILSFTLSWPVVNVTMQELVIQATFSNEDPTCIFGIGPGGNDFVVLGETFLRSAYVVYDLANNELSIAQTLFNATTSNIVEITNDVNGVPGAVRAPTATTITSSISTPITSTSSATGPAHPSQSQTSGHLSGGAKAGIVLGAVAGAAIICLAIFLVRRRLRKGAAAHEPDPATEEYTGKPELSAEGKKPTELQETERAELPERTVAPGTISELHGSAPPLLELDNDYRR